MTIRIHEADGTPYEHVLDIRSPFKRYEVPFNTKYKRVRRNTKRYLARQAAAQAAAEGDADAAAAMDMVDMGFGLEIWEKEQERENWKVADWTEEDEQNMAGQTYEWIRIDADFEWIAAIAFDQKDYMWVSQLQRDRDVVAQYEVCRPICNRRIIIHKLALGHHGSFKDPKCHHIQHVDEDGISDKLLLPYSLRGCGCTCQCKSRMYTYCNLPGLS